MAGAPGLEPGNGGIKIRCLTTWLRPNGRRAGRHGARTIAAGVPPSNAWSRFQRALPAPGSTFLKPFRAVDRRSLRSPFAVVLPCNRRSIAYVALLLAVAPQAGRTRLR